MAVDLLAFGPHPDDLEIGLAGTIARHVADGRRVGLCDLTAGEMGSNGTVAERLAEAEAARAALGAVWRENLGLPDRRIGKEPSHLDQVVAFLRLHQPQTIAVPFWADRHPDHVAASELLTEGAFNAGLRRYRPDLGEAWRPALVCYYFINDHAAPSFAVDVTAHYETKRRALDCHRSQFERPGAGAGAADGVVDTRLNTPLFRQLIESRDAQFGAQAGVRWAEGFVVRTLPLRANLLKDPA